MTRNLATLWKLVANHRRLLPFFSGVILLVSTLTIVVPLYTKAVLEAVIPAHDSRMLSLTFFLFLGFLLVRFVLVAVQDLAVVVLRQKLERSYNERYIEAILRLRLADLARHQAGALVSRFSVFINEIEWFLCDFIFFVLYALFIFVFLTIVMLLVNPGLYLVVLAFAPLHVLNFHLFAGKLRRAATENQDAQERLSSFVLQTLDGWHEIRNYWRQESFSEQHREITYRLNRAYFVRKALGFSQKHVQAALVMVNHITILAVGAYQIITGATQVGTLFFFLLLLDFFYSPIYRFSAVNEALQAACVKIERMAELIETPNLEALPEPTDTADHEVKPSAPLAGGRRETRSQGTAGASSGSSRQGSVSAEPRAACGSVQQRATVQSLTLEDLSCEGLFAGCSYRFLPNRLYFITGPSGCGKTSLLHLIIRLREPSGGRVLLDGQDTSSWPEPRLRKQVQLGLQEQLLLRRSIARNIHLGDPAELDPTRLQQAIHLAALDRFVEQLPDREHHEVAEGGANLSGGQQQRLCLARLFYADAPVLLLDEPTSALDLATESLFFERLQEIKKHKIILLINHRDQSLQHADVTLRLTPGGLCERTPTSTSAGS